jgi:hypothetical protein
MWKLWEGRDEDNISLCSSTVVNATIAEAMRKATGTKAQKGEDLIRDPKLRAAFIELKKLAKKR